ncbi:hypothetical protein ROHU_008902 [Labeo rohita]|uniref:Uncharacterized protein n=1 Tax=Labeo rohita TaxID=84645 RepID=A0A498MCI7_LABRO|nr:hypothetical protein ROHU_008902 [Labeo rohita]
MMVSTDVNYSYQSGQHIAIISMFLSQMTGRKMKCHGLIVQKERMHRERKLSLKHGISQTGGGQQSHKAKTEAYQISVK